MNTGYTTAPRDGFDVPLIGIPQSAEPKDDLPELHNPSANAHHIVSVYSDGIVVSIVVTGNDRERIARFVEQCVADGAIAITVMKESVNTK